MREQQPVTEYFQLTVSGGGGCPGAAALRAAEEEPELAPDSATLRRRPEVERIAPENLQKRESATTTDVIWLIFFHLQSPDIMGNT